METHGPLGTIWVGIALICFYIALTWVNLLLGHFLTPLFIIPGTWVMDAFTRRKDEQDSDAAAERVEGHTTTVEQGRDLGPGITTPNKNNVGG